ncbi:3-hydroxyacyl-CoA dehydrogenase family protein [Actinophytocola oryzae]|uniref:Methoxymalonate biosynthesis protein n=1 Tax=Actinophytocola oryzae TaxID=502181 RepID=A0A4R7VFG9_9PSEU|nr:3-hydroxyacyl-CoA dehydrogenase family protein [Actinophytocola oryzae]TDV47972.1 methoxymalonate biosynthesis protein [Actinophytocola oryzae]
MSGLVLVGAGTMGVNIAALALGHGLPVTLVDLDTAILDRAATGIRTALRHGQLMGALPADTPVATARTTTDLTSVAGAEVVIEAVTENAECKAKLLAEVAGLVSPGTPLVSNTSGIPIDELAGAVPRPEDVIGTHFMNPTYLIGTTEVVRGPRTSEPTLRAVTVLLARMGRRSVVVNDSPGFVTSRLLHPMINDAARLVQAGTATVEQVDELMRGCLGHPTGPLRTADLIGLDNLADALRVLADRTGETRYAPCELLLAKVADGHHGRKSGRGFYDYGKVLS